MMMKKALMTAAATFLWFDMYLCAIYAFWHMQLLMVGGKLEHFARTCTHDALAVKVLDSITKQRRNFSIKKSFGLAKRHWPFVTAQKFLKLTISCAHI